ncbi:hypothetical protein GCM10009677_43630 [Sphaerisporangium rubeum]|uniref:Uncharacterized protein n=1 Tax=Sphaerisporangium rubeum TaxID=321317 RepID=A0A7X0IJQ9_9ACTN|nr:hypothetical protein [Sphaerisporangium rubeum]MBB6476475.1 hypothetical protein [Sphaerisporangium rubeum]
MTHTPDRLAYINSLRDLADFLDTNPDIPLPDGTLTATYYPRGTDEEICDQVTHVARLMSADINAHDLVYGHVSTSVSFGLAEYKAVGILAAARARWDARRSYADSITLNPTTRQTVTVENNIAVIRHHCGTCGGTGVDSLAQTCRDCDGTGIDNHGA